jgi:hypothetical protein
MSQRPNWKKMSRSKARRSVSQTNARAGGEEQDHARNGHHQRPREDEREGGEEFPAQGGGVGHS